jgi:PmbA protein
MTERILKSAKKKADSAEVYTETSSELEISFEAGILKSIERKQVSAVGLRIIKNGRIGFSSTTDLSRTDDLVESALMSAQFGKKAAFSFPSERIITQVNTFDPAVESFEPETAVEEGHRTIELLYETCPDGLTDIHFSASTDTVRIMNTAGFDQTYRTTGFSHGVTSVIIEGDSILWISDGGEYSTLEINTGRYIDKISQLAHHSKRTSSRISANLPVIFVADELGNLFEAIEMGVNGKRLLKGDSPLIGREGKRVLGSVTIIDDPLRDFAPSSYPFDDEGVPAKPHVIFRDGFFESFLFDLDTGAKTGRASTGNASRGALSQPVIDTSNLIMPVGDTPLESMIAGLSEGIIVYGVLGGGQSNLLAGDFALNVMLGFHIVNGEFAGRLIDTMVSGNVYEAFGDIRATGSEQRQVGSLFVPDICIDNLPVSGG